MKADYIDILCIPSVFWHLLGQCALAFTVLTNVHPVLKYSIYIHMRLIFGIQKEYGIKPGPNIKICKYSRTK